MSSGQQDYEVDGQTKSINRREELREHVAKGRGLGVDEGIVTDLNRAAKTHNHAVNELDSGKQVAKIEKETLLPTLDKVEQACNENDGVSG